MQSQNQTPIQKITAGDDVILVREIRYFETGNRSNQHLFMHKDKMASWIYNSIDDSFCFDHHDIYIDILWISIYSRHALRKH